ncbi:hypothetical protein [Actinomadura sp.]|uniref:hypothetical protein n=1 Tax=Actinomadura sp. TaxID=1989 RepID=UPI0037C6A73B
MKGHMMDTPSMPGNGSGKVTETTGKAGRSAGDAAGKAAGKAAGGTADTARETAGTAGSTAQSAGRAAAGAGGQVAALPGRATALVKLVNLRKFLRAAPVAAAAVAGLVVGRLTARKR